MISAILSIQVHWYILVLVERWKITSGVFLNDLIPADLLKTNKMSFLNMCRALMRSLLPSSGSKAPAFWVSNKGIVRNYSNMEAWKKGKVWTGGAHSTYFLWNPQSLINVYRGGNRKVHVHVYTPASSMPPILKRVSSLAGPWDYEENQQQRQKRVLWAMCAC